MLLYTIRNTGSALNLLDWIFFAASVPRQLRRELSDSTYNGIANLNAG